MGKAGWVFFDESCVLVRGRDIAGLEARGQKIPSPAKENSTTFRLSTDDTKGYVGSDIVLNKVSEDFTEHAHTPEERNIKQRKQALKGSCYSMPSQFQYFILHLIARLKAYKKSV